MKKNKKKFTKLTGLIFPIFAIGLLVLGFYISDLLELPGSFFCPEYTDRVRPGLCAVPLLGKVVAGFTSPSFWFAIIFYCITFGGFLYVVHKKGYSLD